jgi:hypothetical protein
MKRRILSALLCAALVFLCGCSSPKPSSTPTPIPTATAAIPVASVIAQYADADVIEEDNQLIIGIRVEGEDLDTVCETFISQAEDIYVHCVSAEQYTGVSFSLVRDGLDVAAFFVLPDTGGMKVYEPVVYDTAYSDAVSKAFYDSAFARTLAG